MDKDIEINHGDGTTVVKGVSIDQIKKFKRQVETTASGRGELEFYKVDGLKELQPDGRVNRVIIGKDK